MTDRYYQLVLLKILDSATFAQFVEQASPAASRYEAAERLLTAQSVHGPVEQPDLVNVVYYRSESAYHEWHADPAIRAALPLRESSIHMLWLAGPATSGQPSPATDATGRPYLVEIARYGPAGAAAYRAYEQEVHKVLGPYGYRVERVITPTARSSGWPWQPDRITVAYFPDEATMAAAHADPGHQTLEGERYAAAVADAIWLTAQPLAALPQA